MSKDTEQFGDWQIHAKSVCHGYCPFHNPSDHPLKDAEIHIRGDKMMLVERICEHGVGHDDPDSVRHFIANRETWAGVHGCDGCCTGTALNDLQPSSPETDAPVTSEAQEEMDNQTPDNLDLIEHRAKWQYKHTRQINGEVHASHDGSHWIVYHEGEPSQPDNQTADLREADLNIPERIELLKAIKPVTDRCNSMSRHDINSLNGRLITGILNWHNAEVAKATNTAIRTELQEIQMSTMLSDYTKDLLYVDYIKDRLKSLEKELTDDQKTI